jgi:hypothetical protein
MPLLRLQSAEEITSRPLSRKSKLNEWRYEFSFAHSSISSASFSGMLRKLMRADQKQSSRCSAKGEAYAIDESGNFSFLGE